MMYYRSFLPKCRQRTTCYRFFLHEHRQIHYFPQLPRSQQWMNGRQEHPQVVHRRQCLSPTFPPRLLSPTLEICQRSQGFLLLYQQHFPRSPLQQYPQQHRQSVMLQQVLPWQTRPVQLCHNLRHLQALSRHYVHCYNQFLGLYREHIRSVK